MKPTQVITDKILELVYTRIELGCYTAFDICHCSECGAHLDLTIEEARAAVAELVRTGKVEMRRCGETEEARGIRVALCVPKGLPLGSNFSLKGY